MNAEQLELPLPGPAQRSPEALADGLSREAGRPVALTITRNRVSMASIQFAGAAVRVRLHRAFLAAPEAVLRALGDYVRRRTRTAWATVRRYAASIAPEPAPARRSRVVARGQVYDLAAIMARMNVRYFEGRVRCRIGWGKRGGRRRRTRSRSIRFGSYVGDQNLVRVHPALDDPRVPEEFVEYIVFHEMLHAAVPSERRSGRLAHHHAAFRSQERRFADIARMRRISRELVPVLTARLTSPPAPRSRA